MEKTSNPKSVSDLLRTDSLEILNVSGCGIKAAGGTALSEVLSSGCNLKTLSLDVSNNDFGQPGETEFYPFRFNAISLANPDSL